MNKVRKALRALLRIGDTPERTAFAFAMGVFIGFSPFLGLHTLMGILAAFTLKLNRVAVLLGVYINNPWLVAPYYALATWFGVMVSGGGPVDAFPQFGPGQILDADFWLWILSQWRLLFPAFLGSTVLSVIFSLAAYPLALYVLRRSEPAKTRVRDDEPLPSSRID